MLAILPSTVADARMRVLNADGSEAEMCGNGIRCVAKVLHDSDPALRRPRLRIETGAGVLECEVAAPRGLAEEITVDMGRPRLTREEIPLSPPGPGRALRETISVAGRTFRFTGVSMGNPHAVFLGEEGRSAPARGAVRPHPRSGRSIPEANQRRAGARARG